MSSVAKRMRVEAVIEAFPLASPFRITGHTFMESAVVTVTLSVGGHRGRGEGCGVYYFDETADVMMATIEAVRGDLEHGIGRQELQRLLPASGARNALDCALWDLEASFLGVPVWKLAGVRSPEPLLTTCTVGIDTPEAMARKALAYVDARAIKLKLSGDGRDAERVRAVRGVCAGIWLGVDANQGFTAEALEALMPTLEACDVRLIEQPFPVGAERLLDSCRGSIDIALDESIQTLGDIAAVANRCQVVNIKLDKCGGLTEGLQMAHAARARGLKVMVGNMTGTSLSMAPGFVLGQSCDVVDLDGPLLLAKDRAEAVRYVDGYIHCDPAVWGGGVS